MSFVCVDLSPPPKGLGDKVALWLNYFRVSAGSFGQIDQLPQFAKRYLGWQPGTSSKLMKFITLLKRVKMLNQNA